MKWKVLIFLVLSREVVSQCITGFRRLVVSPRDTRTEAERRKTFKTRAGEPLFLTEMIILIRSCTLTVNIILFSKFTIECPFLKEREGLLIKLDISPVKPCHDVIFIR